MVRSLLTFASVCARKVERGSRARPKSPCGLLKYDTSKGVVQTLKLFRANSQHCAVHKVLCWMEAVQMLVVGLVVVVAGVPLA